MLPTWIQSCNASKTAAAGPRLRPHSHWDRPLHLILRTNFIKTHTTFQDTQCLYWYTSPSRKVVHQSPYWRNLCQMYGANWSPPWLWTCCLAKHVLQGPKWWKSDRAKSGLYDGCWNTSHPHHSHQCLVLQVVCIAALSRSMRTPRLSCPRLFLKTASLSIHNIAVTSCNDYLTSGKEVHQLDAFGIPEDLWPQFCAQS
jgi:hypothetical protein